jgi:hypothetical protein
MPQNRRSGTPQRGIPGRAIWDALPPAYVPISSGLGSLVSGTISSGFVEFATTEIPGAIRDSGGHRSELMMATARARDSSNFLVSALLAQSENTATTVPFCMSLMAIWPNEPLECSTLCAGM